MRLISSVRRRVGRSSVPSKEKIRMDWWVQLHICLALRARTYLRYGRLSVEREVVPHQVSLRWDGLRLLPEEANGR